jgi:hypothetical protein
MAEDGFLDAHLPLLHVGDAQSMVFKPTNIGPWYLLPAQKEVQRRDRVTGKSKLLEKSKKQLLEQLKEVGVTLQQQRGYTKKELQTFAQNNGIELCERKEQIMAGWEGQSKGLLQVLCKRAGLTKNQDVRQVYTQWAKDTITGKVDVLYSLWHLLAECSTGFKHEETVLQ